MGGGSATIIGLVDTVLAIDRLWRTRLRSILPDTDELWTDPQGRLARQPIVIGPRRRYAVATVMGLFVGCIVCCGILGYWDEYPGRVQRLAPRTKVVLMLGVPVVVSLIVAGFISHLLRGGELILRPAGLVLRYRKDRVFCPWALYQEPRGSWRV